MSWDFKANLKGAPGYNATNAAEDDAAIGAFITEGSGPTAAGAAVTAKAAAAVTPAITQASKLDRRDPRPRAIIFGTSLEAQNGVPMLDIDTVSGVGPEVSGWVNWMNPYIEQRLQITRNAGVGGNRFDQMLTRLQADVLAYPSEWVLIGGPVNDVSAPRTAAAIIADMKEIHKQILAAGRRVHQLTAAPSDFYDTAAKRSALDEVNAYIWTLDNTPGITVSDAFEVLRKPGEYGPAVGYVVDGIHWNDQGAHRVGYLAAQRIAAALPPLPRGVQAPLAQRNHFRGLFDAAPTSSVVAGTTVSVPSPGRILYKATNMADADIPGAGWEINISTGRFAIGDKLQLQARVRWFDVEAKLGLVKKFNPVAKLQFRNVDSSFGPEAVAFIGASSRDRALVHFQDSGEMLLRTQVGTVSDTTNRVYARFEFAGVRNGYFEVSDIRVIKTN